jgi:hypothetical protein
MLRADDMGHLPASDGRARRTPTCRDLYVGECAPTHGDRQSPCAQRPNAQATISGNASPQKSPPCGPTRSFMTTPPPALRSAFAHQIAFSRKNCSWVPATSYTRGSELGISAGGL